ncbi:MAG TPA: DUF58 domain-containing protein [Streptosporangiaceae bacterium]
MPASVQDRQTALSWSYSGHARRLLTFALAGLVIAVVTQRPEFAAAAAPAVLLLAARRPARPDKIGVSVRASALRVTEDEQASVEIVLSGTGEFSASVLARPAETVRLSGQRGLAGAAVTLPFRVTRWGQRQIGTVEVVLRDRWRLLEGRVTVPLPVIACYPGPAPQESRIVLSRLLNWLGEHPARAEGSGMEFLGVREFVPGDWQRRINWPATTRRGSLQLNTYAAERTQSVVLIADVTTDVGEAGASSVDLVMRAAAGTARSYLRARDRVGFISYSGSLSWLAPGSGTRQYFRIVNAMLAPPGLATPGLVLDRLPRAALPPGALIMVFSPLLNRRLIEALRDLRERGFAVLIIDVLNAEPPPGSGSLAGMARRIWRMEQQAIRFSLREIGIPVVHWDGRQPLDEPLAPYTRRVMVTGR